MYMYVSNDVQERSCIPRVPQYEIYRYSRNTYTLSLVSDEITNVKRFHNTGIIECSHYFNSNIYPNEKL